MTIFEALREDHDHQRTLVDALVETEGASSERKRLFEELKTALDVHALAEERHFYVPLMTTDMSQEQARHGVAEHKELDDYLEKLEATDHASSAWLPLARTLRERLLHHLEEEEREFFQLAGRVLGERQKTELGEKYRAEMTSRQGA